MQSRRGVSTLAVLLSAAAISLPARPLKAQDEGAASQPETPPKELPAAPNTTAGELTPSRGFDLIKTDLGSLNISFYGLMRYVNQLPAEQTFFDHLGRERVVPTRHDLYWHRTFIWLSGFFWKPQLRYTISIWSLPSTQQTLAFGILRYRVARWLEIGAGIGPNLGSRSMQGSWPYFLGSDRQMADDFFRPGFASSVWMTGEPLGGLNYNVAVANNVSQLGVPLAQNTRDMSLSATVWWMPTTGEFGPRGGFGDFEHHGRLATRFGASAVHSRESRYNQLSEPSPLNTQIRLSDGLLAFETGALADGVTMQKADYDYLSTDLGFKLRGFHLQTEYYLRRLSHFVADGALPLSSIFDHGFYVQAMHMILPQKLGGYGAVSYVFDDFGRRPWEVSGGASFYPSGTRSWRLNLHYFYVVKSPAGSSFGYYTAGQTGSTVSLGVDLFL